MPVEVTIATVVMGTILSAFALGMGYMAHWDERRRDEQRGRP